MASPLFVRSTPKGIRWRVALVPTGSGRWLEVEISKLGQRGLLRQQRALWDLAAACWDRGQPPLALPNALAPSWSVSCQSSIVKAPLGVGSSDLNPGPGLWRPFGAGRPIWQKPSPAVVGPFRPSSSRS